MKISEMTLEELQDYAVQQDAKITELTTQLNDSTTTITDLQSLNTALQKRNNALFLQVEQQTSQVSQPGQEGAQEPAKTPDTCEQFAQNKYKELIK